MTRLPSILSASFPSSAVGLSPSYALDPRLTPNDPDGTAPGKKDVDSEVCRGTVVTAVLTATPATIGAPAGTAARCTVVPVTCRLCGWASCCCERTPWTQSS